MDIKRIVHAEIKRAWEYYKKYAYNKPVDWDAAIKEGTKMVEESPVPLFMRDLFFAIEDQLGREESENITK